uniref:EamA domain-containing protein n=1 Tax=Brassica campestris TaxID=3711 RepID=M4FGY1_BRACM
MSGEVWRWVLGLTYILAVATIWIASSFVVQSVVDAGVSPFLITFICNSLFVVYLPIFEISRYLEDSYGSSILFWRNKRSHLLELAESEKTVLLGQDVVISDASEVSRVVVREDANGLDEKGRWTRMRVAKVSLLICPFWFLAQLTFNLSLKYTTVTLPDDDERSGSFSMAQLLGFLGLFNFFIFLPAAIILNFTKRERFNALTLEQFGLVVGKGLLDNVLSDYLWAKAVLLTTTTVATAGLTIQVPLAAIVDRLSGNKPSFTDYIGAAAVMVGFAGINIPSESKETAIELEPETLVS